MQSILWPDLTSRRVLLAVSGGIAAYKAAELCRLLVRCGASVHVMMTASGRRFVTEVTFGALSGHPVATDLFDPVQEAQIGHIGLADQSDLLLVAPATANLMAKLAHGLADDLVSTVALAFAGPVLLAPAMNVHMWEHAATRQNIETLVARGCRLVGPGSGEMACGHVGEGRMAEPELILQAAAACLVPQDLEGRAVLVTAGPTHEPLDPVRFVGNRSSGKMGFALAAEAVARGARTTLIAGPCSLATPFGVERVDVTTAAQMAEAVRARLDGKDALIMAAAVADYRPTQTAPTKLKKEEAGAKLSLELMRTEDILGGLSRGEGGPVVIGFAAETGDLEKKARAKLTAKRCDLLVANDVSQEGAGFEVDTNRVTLLDSSGERQELPLCSKREVARRILDRLPALLRRAGREA